MCSLFGMDIFSQDIYTTAFLVWQKSSGNEVPMLQKNFQLGAIGSSQAWGKAFLLKFPGGTFAFVYIELTGFTA